MLDAAQISEAVDLQKRSYRLLRWIADAVEQGFVPHQAANSYGSTQTAALAWLTERYDILPLRTRPARHQLVPFAGVFSTYLENSFDILPRPTRQLYSPEAHCFCPLCSWLVDAPRLRPKKVRNAHKRRAREMQRDVVLQLAQERGVPLNEAEASALLGVQELREPLALVAYAADLLKRLQGVASGPAVLVLWRRFAWHPEGAPKKGYTLEAAAILEAEDTLRTRILAAAQRIPS